MTIKPLLDSPEFEAKQQELQAFLWQYSSDVGALLGTGASFEIWWNELIEAEWNRAALYLLVSEPLVELREILAKHAIKLLESCKSGLMLNDDVTVDNIYRLKGEPEDWNEFLRFVYSYKWLPKQAD